MLAEEVIRKSPLNTLTDVKPYFDEVGITRVADITGMDRIGIPVYAAIRPDSKSLAVDSGKGLTKRQAKCSAVMEAIERWAQDAYVLKSVAPYSATYTQGRAYRFPMIRGSVFDVELPHRWLEAKYYLSKDPVIVPYYHVKNYEKRLPLYEMCWQSGTNGLAAGNISTEAILNGLYEIIERDAVTIWMAKGAGRRIDEETIDDDEVRRMNGLCLDAGVMPCVCEVTSDLGIPAYICIMVDTRSDIAAYKGYGCNLDSNIAVQRAYCEAAQSRAVFLSGARDDMRWLKHVSESHVSNKQRIAEISMEERHRYKAETCEPMSDERKIELIDSMLTVRGCGHIIVADIMQKEHACVVKVMSEGLEGYWNPYLQLGKRAA
jgi:ribosomal protein S12 methylthiotransferase accessory factor